MNWRTLDLNLLVVFDAVAQTRDVIRAAAKPNMSQLAISHALARLRGALKDELFLRTPDGMEPTHYAEQLAGPVRAALVLAASIAAAAAAEAPVVSLDLRPSGTLDLAERLGCADLDLALVGRAAPGERFADLHLLGMTQHRCYQPQSKPAVLRRAAMPARSIPSRSAVGWCDRGSGSYAAGVALLTRKMV